MTYKELRDTCKYKTLLYFCVFSNSDYIKLLKLLLISLVIFTEDLSQIDLLVFTSANLEEEIQKFAKSLNLTIDTYIFDFTGKDQALCARLYIFEYPLTQLYKQVLYLDTDIIIQGDLNKILQVSSLEEKLYGVKEGTIGHHWWGAELFDFTKIDSPFKDIQTLPAMNSGTLLFPPTNKIKMAFVNIYNDIKEKTEKNIRLPECLDQAYINYYFIKDNIYNNTYLTQYTKFYSKDANISEIVSNNVLCHFTWPIGNALNKLKRMTEFLLNCWPRDSLNIPPYNILNKSYSWNGTGQISFNNNNILKTTWVYGKYRWLNTYIMEVAWSGIYHILKFNRTYSNFISIRTDFDITYGKYVDLGWSQFYAGLKYHMEDAYKEVNKELIYNRFSNYEKGCPKVAIFSRAYYNDMNKLSKIKTHDYCFIGSLTSNRKEREWVIDFALNNFTSNSIFINTDANSNWEKLGDYDYTQFKHGFCNKHHPEPESRESTFRIIKENAYYFETMCQSRYVLCPAGDTSWSFRFYETIMCKSIPIVKSYHHTYRTVSESHIPYKYKLSTDSITDADYDTMVSENTALFEKFHLLHT
jgi:hypothetical protein